MSEPLTAHGFQVLLALSDQERHGKGIVRRVLELTADQVKLWPVTLHRTLDDLQDRQLIVEISALGEHPAGKSRRRRYYRLTDTGARALEVEATRMAELARTARSNLRDRESES